MTGSLPDIGALGALLPGVPQTWNHVGFTVRDIDRSISFWCEHFGFALLMRREIVGDGPVGDLVDLETPHLRAAFLFRAEQSLLLEIVEYVPLADDGAPVPLDAVSAGHLCFWVEEIEELTARLVADGAVPISRRIVDVVTGPTAGGRTIYLRAPDGIALELHRPYPTRVPEAVGPRTALER